MPTNPAPKPLSDTPRTEAFYKELPSEVFYRSRTIRDYCETLEKELNEAKSLMEEFVNRCETGEIRSTKIYNKFKEYLKKYERH